MHKPFLTLGQSVDDFYESLVEAVQNQSHGDINELKVKLGIRGNPVPLRERDLLHPYDTEMLRNLISNWRVTRVKDVEELESLDLIIQLCNLIHENEVEIQQSELGPFNGLYAMRNFNVGDIVAEYGGLIQSDVGAKGQHKGGTYAITLSRMEGKRYPYLNPEGLIIDGYIQFKLSQVGRWANSVPWTVESQPEKRLQNNTQYEVHSGQPDTGQPLHIYLVATRPIPVGQEVLATYGPGYPWDTIYPPEVVEEHIVSVETYYRKILREYEFRPNRPALYLVGTIMEWREQLQQRLIQDLNRLQVNLHHDKLDETVFLVNLVDGPLVLYIDDHTGYGLFADANYEKGMLVTEYNGVKAEGAKERHGRYAQKLGRGNTVVNAEYEFPLVAKGRWMNEPLLELGNGEAVETTNEFYRRMKEKANCELKADLSVVALRKVLIHEELTFVHSFPEQYERVLLPYYYFLFENKNAYGTIQYVTDEYRRSNGRMPTNRLYKSIVISRIQSIQCRVCQLGSELDIVCQREDWEHHLNGHEK